MRLALYQPDIPQNTAAAIRLAACLGVAVDVIEPCGFQFDDKRLRRVGMDYLAHADIVRHAEWSRFCDAVPGRTVLLSTRASTVYTAFRFTTTDTLLAGRESAGVPPDVHAAVSASVRIPLRPGLRSLNVVTALAMVLGEACRQTGWPEFKKLEETAVD